MRYSEIMMKPALIVAAALLTSCAPKTEPAKKADSAKPVEYFHVDPGTAGKLHGKILYQGPKPTRQVIDMQSDITCSQEHEGKPAYLEPVVVGKGGGLANAFVYIQTGLEGKKFEPRKEPVVLDQRGCLFAPRILGVRAGQPLDLRNSDKVSHNVHPVPKNNREWNEQQSPGTPDVEHRFARTEVMIPVKCNIHQWMHAYLGVVEHPYFAVTGPDGAFDLSNLPPGDYTLAVWHEKLGDQTKQVHLAASANEAVDFTYR
jgi:plastocyanin